jgi:uncharacterized membrane protein (DUF4010 family)
MEPKLIGQIATSLLLGLLVGLQRQRAESHVGGIRTFPLIAALGTVCGWLALDYGGWIVAAGLLAVAAQLVVSNLMESRGGINEPGQTTEIAALLLYGIGAYLVIGEMTVAVALGGALAVLLHFKNLLHAFAARIGERDVTAIMEFVLISLVVLPVLPDRALGPYETLNPYQVWLMVVLIVAIGLVGYVAHKLLGERQGAVLGGVIGGLVSSTATTVTFARRTASEPSGAALAALVITIASAMVYPRVMALVATVAHGRAATMLPPLGAMAAASLFVSAALYLACRDRRTSMAEQGNPADLRLALTFAGVYAAISFVVAAAQAELGVRALYPVALLAGLTDVDAITLSTSQLVARDRLAADTAWRLILVASFSNLAFKSILIAAMGGRTLLRLIGPAFSGMIGAGLLILWLMP